MNKQILSSLLIFCGVLQLLHAAPQPLTSDQFPQIEQRIQQNLSLSEEARTALMTRLNEAKEQFQRSIESEQKRVEIQRQSQQAPQQIEALQQAQSKPVDDNLPKTFAEQSKEDLEKLLLATTAETDVLRQQISQLEKTSQMQSKRRSELPNLLATAKNRLNQLQPLLLSDPPSELKEAVEQLHILTAIKDAEAEINLAQLETDTFEASRTLINLQQDQAAQKLNRLEKQKSLLQEEVDLRRKMESEKSAQKAEIARKKALQLHPVILQVAEKNSQLASIRTGEIGLTSKIQTTTQELEKLEQQIASITRRAQELENRLSAVGLTHAIAQLLRREQLNLPDTSSHRSTLKKLKTEIADVQLALLDMDDQRDALRPLRAAIEKILSTSTIPPNEQPEIEELLNEYLTDQQQLLDTLIQEYNNYLTLLADLDTAERQLIEKTTNFSNEIAEHILWVRSDPAPSFRQFLPAFKNLPNRLREAKAFIAADQRRVTFHFHLLTWLVFLLVEAALILLGRICKKRMAIIAAYTRKIRTDRLAYTAETLLYTFLEALPVPLLLVFFGTQFSAVASASPITAAAAEAFRLTALLLLAHLVTYNSLRHDGLAISHLEWEESTMPELRRLLRRVIYFTHPLFWATVFFHEISDHVSINWLERGCLISIQFFLFTTALQAFKPTSRLIQAIQQNKANHRLLRFRVLLQLTTAGIPLIIALMSLVGFHYTSIRAAGWFTQSIALTLVLVGSESLSIRVIRYISRRTEFMRRVRERQEQAAAEATTEKVEHTDIQEPEELSYLSLNENTTKLLHVGFGFALFIGLWFIWKEAIPALGVLDRITLWSVKNGLDATTLTPITLENLFSAIIVGSITLASARHFPALIELVLLRKLPIALGERYAISTITRYIVTGMGITFVFNILGLQWSQIQWLVAALSVGLGFGLQEIFANFISGLIILFERPVRVCDYVTVNGTSGQVSRIQMRATTITDFDNKELLIPNKQFVTGELVNWTLTNSVLRIVVPVGVAYGSDTKKVTAILGSIGRDFHMAVESPPPDAVFAGFGDSSLNFELRVFIRQAELHMRARHELHMAIDAAFRKAGITIAFPQLDLHVIPPPESIPVE